MARQAWKVKLFEARSPADFATSKVAADLIEVFGVQADGGDEAKREATKWLVARGHQVRTVNVSAADERTLVAYVAAGSVAAAKTKGAAK